jgi:type IV secretory pathway TraG/TraD family ATPase VirD4
VRFLTVWHSVAQIRRHFGVDAAAEILALSQAKVFMGSITDHYTREEVVELLGRRQHLTDERDSGQLQVMSAQALQRTSAGEGLLVNGDLPPIIFRQRRHYLDPRLRRLKGVDSGPETLAGRTAAAGIDNGTPPHA